MQRFPGIGRRVTERLRAQGYWKDDRPDVGRFCRELGYRPQYVYAWLQGRTPDYDNLRRLSRDLDAPVAWLVSGEQHAMVATAAGRTRPSGQRRISAAHADDGNEASTPGNSVVDVRRLHEAAAHMLAVQADLDAALAAFPDPCLWLDEEGRVLGVHGPTDLNIPFPVAGALLHDTLPREAAAAFHRAIGQALKTDSSVTTEFAIMASTRAQRVDRAQRVYEVRIAAVHGAARPRRLFGVLRDVTDLRTREAEYRQIVDGSPNGLCIHRDYAIVFANGAIAKLFGYARGADLVGRDVRSLLPEHRVPPPPAPKHLRVPMRHTYEGVGRDNTRVTVAAIAGTVVWDGDLATILTITPHAHPGDPR